MHFNPNYYNNYKNLVRIRLYAINIIKDHACILEVLIINFNEEYEFKFDMSNIPFYMTIKELSNLIN